MSPQKFIKTLPPGYSEEKPPQGFQFLQSQPEGFVAAYRDEDNYLNWRLYTPDRRIAVRLPDGRLVIPTVKGEKG